MVKRVLLERILSDIKTSVKELRDAKDITWDLYRTDVRNRRCEDTSRNKVDTIFRCFKTQGSRSWFTEEVFFSIMRIRGVECNAQEKYAEAFYCRKMTL